MLTQRRVFQTTLAVLFVCCAALGSQEQKQTPKAGPNLGQPAGPAFGQGCPLTEEIIADEGLSHKYGGAYQKTLSPQKLFSCVSVSVMVVQSLDAKGSVIAFGSGVVIGSDHVITNRHVIEQGVSFRVAHGGKEWPAKVIRVDPDHDLAELSVPVLPANAAPVVTRDSSTLGVGEKVYAIGAPEGLELTISEGLISGLRDFGKGKVIQTSAAISPGSSGGGLFDAQGRLIGITTFYLKEGQSLNFALPAEWTVTLEHKTTGTATATSKHSPKFQALLWREIGDAAANSGKYGVASNAYKEAISVMPNDYVAWAGLATAYVGLRDFKKAISAFHETLRLRPNGLTWLLLSMAYHDAGEYGKGVQAAQQAVRLKPDFPNAWQVLGSGYLRLEQYDKAVNAEQEALRLKPDDGDAWQDLGEAYLQLKQFNKAVSVEQQAVQLRPDSARAWQLLGVAYFLLRQYEKSISALRKAVQLDPKDPQLWYGLGLILWADSQKSEVIKVYKKLKTLDPKLAEEFFQQAVLP